MKKFLHSSAIVALLLLGCTGKDGAMGPTGPTGSSGSSENVYITSDTTWSVNQYITGTLVIDYGVTLTIQPGVKIYLYPNTYIRTYGKIIAIGTTGSPIIFTTPLKAHGGQLQIADYSTNIFKYCSFKKLWQYAASDFTRNIFLNCDYISNSMHLWGGSALSQTLCSNSFIGYNHGAMTYTVSSNTNDSGSPQQYYYLQIKSPRNSPNFP
jgi:hypothetical protein